MINKMREGQNTLGVLGGENGTSDEIATIIRDWDNHSLDFSTAEFTNETIKGKNSSVQILVKQ